jgi:hypothetical protein
VAETTTRSLNTTAVTVNTTALTANTAALGSLAATMAATAGASAGGAGAGFLASLFGGGGGGGDLMSTPGAFDIPLTGTAALGGSVRGGGLYQVNERGPEMLTVGNRSYLMMGGRDGYVTPNSGNPPAGAGGGGGGGGSITFSPVINIDSRTDRADVQRLVMGAMEAAQVQLMEKMERRMG